jgi:hypothetical protein
MTRYRISYYEEESGFIYFDAPNLADAEGLLEQLQNGEIDDTDLPEMVKKSRNGQLEFDSLEAVK